MGITLDLPENLVGELTAEANRQGLPLADYVIRVLATARTGIGAVRTGADLVSYWDHEGLVGTRPDIIDSQLHARQTREAAQQRL